MQRASLTQQEIPVIPLACALSQPHLCQSIPQEKDVPLHSYKHFMISVGHFQHYCPVSPQGYTYQTVLELAFLMAFLWDPFGAYTPRTSPRNKMRFRFLKSYRYLFQWLTMQLTVVIVAAVNLFYSSRGSEYIKELEMACINCDSLELIKVLLKMVYQKKKVLFLCKRKYCEQVIMEVYGTALFK